LDASIRLAGTLVADHGVTWIDVSSGGLTNAAPIPVGPGYQVPLAAGIKDALAGASVVISTVGLIEDAKQAETILATGQADAVSIGRAALRDPHWAASAAVQLGVPDEDIPAAPQYWRANWRTRVASRRG
jgi:2,4-dienoyl-CoA reductase-like NADH-dependent reductase (Old Yellow Enzyme family)